MFEKVEELEEIIKESLGDELFLTEILKALSTEEKKEVFDWIIRCYEIETEEETEEEL